MTFKKTIYKLKNYLIMSIKKKLTLCFTFFAFFAFITSAISQSNLNKQGFKQEEFSIKLTDENIDKVYFEGDFFEVELYAEMLDDYEGVQLNVNQGIMIEENVVSEQTVIPDIDISPIQNKTITISGDVGSVTEIGAIAFQFTFFGSAIGDFIPMFDIDMYDFEDGSNYGTAIVGVHIPDGDIYPEPELEEIENLYEADISFVKNSEGSMSYENLNIIDGQRESLLEFQNAVNIVANSDDNIFYVEADPEIVTFFKDKSAEITLNGIDFEYFNIYVSDFGVEATYDDERDETANNTAELNEEVLTFEIDGFSRFTVLETFAVTFEVEDDDGIDIDDATIILDGIENEQGDYEVLNVAPGNFTYFVKKDGYQTAFGEVEIIDQSITELVVLYEGDDPEYDVTFIVKDADTDLGIENANININGDEYTTDADGEAIVENATPYFYDYSIEKNGYVGVSGRIVVTDDDKTVEIFMNIETFTVVFDIIDEFDNPILDAIVTFDGNTNEAGDYVFEDVAGDTYDYYIEKEYFVTFEDQLTVDDDITENITLVRERFDVTFVVMDQDENLIDDAVITFDGVENSPGDYVVEDIAAGFSYFYTVEKEGYHNVEAHITVVDDTTEEVYMEEEEEDNGNYCNKHEITDVRIFPNPANKIINIESNMPLNDISVFDISGKLIKTAFTEHNVYQINVDNLKPGIYLISVSNEIKLIQVFD